jgi:hypothetical protein
MGREVLPALGRHKLENIHRYLDKTYRYINNVIFYILIYYLDYL